MEQEESGSRQFRDVDASKNPSTHVRYLQTVSSLGQIEAMKRRTIDLLGIEPGDRVLDAGCGLGDEVRLMAQRVGRDGLAVGIDSSAVMIAEAQKRSDGLGLPIEFRVGDIYQLDYPGDSFDGCRIERVLQHLDDPQRALLELVRVTKPGGAVVAMEPDWETMVVDLPDVALVRKIVHIFCTHANRNPWIGRQLYRRFDLTGLTDVVVEPGVVTMTDPTLTRNILSLDATVNYGVENALLSTAEVAAWSKQFETAGASGSFFAALSAFVVVGRKPKGPLLA